MEALKEAVQKLWDIPKIKYFVVYNQDGSATFNYYQTKKLSQLFNIESDFNIHPVFIFAALMSPMTTLIDINLSTINKLELNDYQNFSITNGSISIYLKLPHEISPNSLFDFEIEPRNIRRPPQLRKTLINYFDESRIEYNTNRLKSILEKFGYLEMYSYDDADEIFLKSKELRKDTYFEDLPLELIQIIEGYLQNMNYLPDNQEYSEGKSNLIELLTDNIIKSNNELEDATILDIYKNLQEKGGLDEFNNYLKKNSANDFLKYIREDVGFDNLLSIVKSKLTS